MSKKRFDSIWDAIEVPAEAENMKLRAKPMRAINEVEELRTDLRGWLQHVALHSAAWLPEHFELDFQRASILDGYLVRGKIDLFSIDTLINMASAAGLHVDLRVARAT